MPKDALLLSGGVDSSVALHLMMERGEEPDLFYIYIGADQEGYESCPSEEDMEMVKWLARRYGRPLEVVNLHREYWDYVVRYIIDTVKEGRTPHPDILCNRVIKFGYFDEYAGKAYDRIATGHYADKTIIEGRHFLATAVDPVKDQTDFLAQMTYPQLVKAHFPLGNLPKSEVRRIASMEHLVTARRKDSQGICFLGKVDYNQFIERHLGTLPGEIIDMESGRVVGEHKGYWFHTIGQRKGLGLSGGPWFVIRKDIENNRLYVSRGYDPDSQYGNVVEMPEMHFITIDPMEGDEMEVTFKVRHTPDFTKGLLQRSKEGIYTLRSTELIQGIAPGQFCTVYDRDSRLCYGSGVIGRGFRE
ncbi:MAG: tRNA 2-thiouridine(34) synthase MnmA [Porphyromonas sp.]|nr:tRNA 2-thiouridine(34) synthase MnmA [Porphyromonas sp.]